MALISALGAAQAQRQPPGDDALHVTLGAGVVSAPRFPGSDEHKTRAIPILSLEYGRFFLGSVPGATSPLGLGVNLWEGGGLRLGAALVSDLSDLRQEDDDVRLRGLGDIKGTQRAALFGTYQVNRFVLRGHAATDIGDHQLGSLATLEADALFQPTEALSLSVGPGLTWHSRQAMQTLFGIDDAESAASGRATYRPDAGLSQWRVTAGALYRIDAHWSVGGRVAHERLTGDAADSPVVFKRSQDSLAFFTSYRF